MHVSGRDSNKFCKFHEFWRTLRKCHNFILFLRSGAVGIFLSKIITSPNCLKFQMHVLGGDSNKFCKFHEFWRTLRKCHNFILFLRSGALGIFLSKIVTSPNCLKFHMHVSGSDSNKFCKYHEFWRTLRKCHNFILFLRVGAAGIFLSKIVTSPNCLKFHMHVSGSDSNKFCKFHEFWRTLRKCHNFILFLRSGAVGIFLSKIETSPNCLKFQMHVLGGDSNKFCKFHEFRRTLRKCHYFILFLRFVALGIFLSKIVTSPNCLKFHMHVSGGDSNKFCKFHEFWRTLRKCHNFILFLRSVAVGILLSKIVTSPNSLKFQMHVSGSNSDKFCKFHEFWRTLRKCHNFILFLRSGAVGIFLSKIVTSPNCLKFQMHGLGGDSNKFCKFHEFWRTLRKCHNFILFLRSSAVGIFLSKIVTSPNCLKFQTHVLGGDSNKFCKFHEFWRTLRKCHNFIFFLRSGAVGILLSKIVTSPNSLKFHMHVSGSDSNKFCKFHEFWRTLRKCHNFIVFLRSGAVGIFLSKIVTSPNCLKFQMHVLGGDSNKFCKFHEFWRTLRKCHNFILFLRSGAVGIFLSKIVTSPNSLKFHMHVSGSDSNKFCKFHEFWRTLRKCHNFILFLRSVAVGIFLSKIVTSPNCLKFHMHVSGGDSINSVSFMNFGELWENVIISSFF